MNDNNTPTAPHGVANDAALAQAGQAAPAEKCRGCSGHGMVGGLLPGGGGYDGDECPFCKGSGTEAAPAGEVASGRTAKDYAIEHAEYMAACSERLIEAVNDLAMAEQERDEGTANPSDVNAAQDTLRECLGTMRNQIYEFRKRRDRAIPATEPAAPGCVSDEEAEGARQVVEVYDKLHSGKVGQHWLWAVIEQIAAGVPEDEVLKSFGYYEKQEPCFHRPACEECAEDRALAGGAAK